MVRKRSRYKYVVFSGARQLTWTTTKDKNKINRILADEYRREHNVKIGRLRPSIKKRR